jgi:hypothetical protein
MLRGARPLRKATVTASRGGRGLRVLYTHLRNLRRYEAVAWPYALIWIDPTRVTKKLAPGEHRFWVPGTIVGGDWDLTAYDYARSPKFQGLVERFEHGRPWLETSLFRDVYADRLKRNGQVMGARSLAEVARYYETRIEPLYHKMVAEGFRPPSLLRRIDAVYVYIGRDGTLMVGAGGNHRMSIAKLIPLESVPVRVCARHEQWQEIRERIAAGPAAAATGSWDHDDVQDIRPARAERGRAPGSLAD